MRSFVPLFLVVGTCSAACGIDAVDLTGITFEAPINCPGNKDVSEDAMGCVSAPVQESVKGLGGAFQTQISNVFHVDVCGVQAIPDYCGSDKIKKESGFSGIQVTKDYDPNDPNSPKKTFYNCYGIGTSESKQFAYLDDDNPDEGVKVTYKDGTKCGNKPRTFEVNFHCSDQSNDANDNVIEPGEDTCHYIIDYNTVKACPSYCVTGSNLCHNHGICGNEDEPCLCYKGFTGKYCATEGTATDGSGGWTAAAVCLTIAILLLAALLAFIIYMWFKLRRLEPVDTEAYSNLSNKFNELGQIT